MKQSNKIQYKGYIITEETDRNAPTKTYWMRGFSKQHVRDADQARFQIDKITQK